MISGDVLIHIQPTPNPVAWKFVLDRSVLDNGKATYSNLQEAAGSFLAAEIFKVEGVKQIHFFQNVITVTGNFDVEEEIFKKSVVAVIQTRFNMHDPTVTKIDENKKRRESLPPDVQKIEEILDNTIRPGLQGDGGDLTVMRLEGNDLFVHYEGACGSCPSSTQGTLMAIEGILREQFKPEINVIPV